MLQLMLCGLRSWLRRHTVLGTPSSPSGKLGGRVHAYVAAVLAVAAGLSAAVLLASELRAERLWLVPVLAGLVLLEYLFSVRLRRGEQGETISHEETLIVVMALLLPPASALLAFAAGVLASQLAQPAARLKAAFNVGQLVGSAALAFLVVAAIAPAGDNDARRVVATLLGVLAFSLANRGAVAGVLALTGASSFRATLRDDFGPVALVWLGTVAVGLLAGLATLAHTWTLPFALAAMVALSIAFSGHTRARRERHERAHQEEQLLRAEEKHRRLVEQLPLTVYAFTPADRGPELRALARYVSPQVEAMLGYTPDDWRDDPDLYSTIVHPDDRARVREEVQRARALGDRFRSEYRMVAKDGRVVWVYDESVYLRDEDGQVGRVEGFLLDISERKELEQVLAQAQKMEAIGQLAGGIAHDFNNLMCAVIGFGELVLSELAEHDPTRPQVAQIVRAGERAAALTNQLLAFSRRQILQPRPLDLNAVVADSETLLRRLIGEDIALHCTLDPDLEPVLADPAQLEQVILNLAVNARDAMPTGGKLTIETANIELDTDYAATHFDLEPGPYALLTVSDTGAGMSAETQARIFEPFYTTKAEGKGTGLGLATVFGILKQSGGDISLYSEPGHGTTFKLYLPRAGRPSTHASQPPADRAAQQGSETVLLVEDEDLVRDLARQILEQCGYAVLEAANPPRALELAATHPGPIHLLLTDVVLPELSGRELAKQLRLTRPELKILYSSGYAGDAIVRHGVLEAEVEFLAKPFTLTSLAAKVRNVLDNPNADEQPATTVSHDDLARPVIESVR